MGGWSEAIGSRAKSERRSAVRDAGDKAASAEALRIIPIRVVRSTLAAATPISRKLRSVTVSILNQTSGSPTRDTNCNGESVSFPPYSN